ncbi:ribonuclease III [Pseudomonadota bacterium]
MNQPIDRLLRALDYQFLDQSLLEQALTHRSMGSTNNERLEFLGDAILGAVVAAELYQRFPRSTEGELTRLRAALVKGDSLAEIGFELDLGDYIRLGTGELKSGGFRRASILACAIEALIGAVYLDSGSEAARQLILKLYAERLKNVSPEDELKDPKTRLQEFLQSKKQSLPIYELIKVEGEAHAQTFYIECKVEGLDLAVQGKGVSRRKAEQAAAKEVLSLVNKKSGKKQVVGESSD